MRTFLRFLVAIPLLIVGISAIVLTVMSVDYHWLSILAVGNWFVFGILLNIYEDLVYSFGIYLKDKFLETVF